MRVLLVFVPLLLSGLLSGCAVIWGSDSAVEQSSLIEPIPAETPLSAETERVSEDGRFATNQQNESLDRRKAGVRTRPVQLVVPVQALPKEGRGGLQEDPYINASSFDIDAVDYDPKHDAPQSSARDRQANALKRPDYRQASDQR